MTQVSKIAPEAGAEIIAPADPMISMIERIAMDPNVPAERIGMILDLRERQMDKEAEQSFNAAFAAAMAEMPDAPHSGKNKHLGNRYSTLDDLIRTARPVLAAHGLSLNWQTNLSDGLYTVTAIVRHSLGHQIETSLTGQRDAGKQMNALQGGGSTETYLKRYTGFSILGLSSGDEADDDGNGAVTSTETISAEQFRTIRDLVEKASVKESLICQAEGVSELFELPASRFEFVVEKLKIDIQNKAKAQ